MIDTKYYVRELHKAIPENFRDTFADFVDTLPAKVTFTPKEFEQHILSQKVLNDLDSFLESHPRRRSKTYHNQSAAVKTAFHNRIDVQMVWYYKRQSKKPKPETYLAKLKYYDQLLSLFGEGDTGYDQAIKVARKLVVISRDHITDTTDSLSFQKIIRILYPDRAKPTNKPELQQAVTPEEITSPAVMLDDLFPTPIFTRVPVTQEISRRTTRPAPRTIQPQPVIIQLSLF